MERSCGCDWPDLQVDRTVRMDRGGIGCDAVHRNLGTPGVRGATGSKLRLLQRLRCVWVLIWCDKPYCIY
jgi:hypothetical protein